MGYRTFDQYSLLHFATGVVAYFLGVPFDCWVLLHAFFEFVENTPAGIRFINRRLAWFWPGGKPRPDAVVNSIGDTVSAAVGWVVAVQLDRTGRRRDWYRARSVHLNRSKLRDRSAAN